MKPKNEQYYVNLGELLKDGNLRPEGASESDYTIKK